MLLRWFSFEEKRIMQQQHNTKDDKGTPGMYIKLVDNLTRSDIQVKVREYQNLSFAMEAGETDKPANFPLPWVSSVNDEGKCTLIVIPGLSLKLLLWDDKASGAFYSKTQWNTQADKVLGNAGSWGDYKLTIKEDGRLRMDKMQ